MANNTLLDRWGGSHVPARRESGQEPYEPSEQFEDRSQIGRSPEEVVQPREREYADTPTEEVSTPTAGKTKKFVIGGREFDLNETQQKALIEYGAQAFAQQQQAAAQAQAAPPVITNKMIAQVYDEIAQTIINDLVENGGLVEEDLVEMYPRAMKTMVGQMRWLADRSFDQEFKQNQMYAALERLVQRAEATIAWLNAHKAAIEGEQPGTPRQGKQFVTRAGGAALLNKLVANSGRIRQ